MLKNVMPSTEYMASMAVSIWLSHSSCVGYGTDSREVQASAKHKNTIRNQPILLITKTQAINCQEEQGEAAAVEP